MFAAQAAVLLTAGYRKGRLWGKTRRPGCPKESPALGRGRGLQLERELRQCRTKLRLCRPLEIGFDLRRQLFQRLPNLLRDRWW